MSCTCVSAEMADPSRYSLSLCVLFRPFSSSFSSSSNNRRSLSACFPLPTREKTRCLYTTGDTQAPRPQLPQEAVSPLVDKRNPTWPAVFPKTSVHERLHAEARRKTEKSLHARHLLSLLEGQAYSFRPKVSPSSLLSFFLSPLCSHSFLFLFLVSSFSI